MSSAELEFAPTRLSHQFEELAQQTDTYLVGMWVFLVTEIMFFGVLFVTLTIYRANYGPDFEEAHTALNVWLGLLNTFNLLTSSFFMAMGVRAKTLNKNRQALVWIGLTILCAFGFLVVKYFEYSAEIRDHHFPGPTFRWEQKSASLPMLPAGSTLQNMSTLASSDIASRPGYQTQVLSQHPKQLFFSLYFVMTGLHGVHVIVGILILSTMWFLLKRRHPCMDDYIPLEMAGLYWHFVDIVWIFLFPLIYLVGRQ